ncbi:MAG: molecular chaperone Tir [Candidatus Lokiarchaeota archaeon]|nr:molecular chaperone Tir [Candidatus Lokiarchaeota archaeon]
MGGGSGGYVSSPVRGTKIDELEGIARGELQKGVTEPRRKVFISFSSENLGEKRLLVGQAKNENSELDFIDFSLKVPFNSENADYIRRGIRQRISQSSVTVVLVTDVTHRSRWVNWEIRESIRQNKGVVVVDHRKDKSIRMPSAVNENRKKIRTVPWNHREINDAVRDAAESR